MTTEASRTSLDSLSMRDLAAQARTEVKAIDREIQSKRERRNHPVHRAMEKFGLIERLRTSPAVSAFLAKSEAYVFVIGRDGPITLRWKTSLVASINGLAMARVEGPGDSSYWVKTPIEVTEDSIQSLYDQGGTGKEIVKKVGNLREQQIVKSFSKALSLPIGVK